VMRQSGAETLVTEEPDALIAHVRDCGGAGWVTTGSTRKRTAHSAGFVAIPGAGGCGLPLTASVMRHWTPPSTAGRHGPARLTRDAAALRPLQPWFDMTWRPGEIQKVE
jgi:hypothetical protein